MQSVEDRIKALEKELDQLIEQKFLLEQDLKKEAHLRAEMQEFLGNIYDSCRTLEQHEDPDMDVSDVIRNLLQNIRDFAESYKISL